MVLDYVAHQAPLSLGFSRQEYWCPSNGLYLHVAVETLISFVKIHYTTHLWFRHFSVCMSHFNNNSPIEKEIINLIHRTEKTIFTWMQKNKGENIIHIDAEKANHKIQSSLMKTFLANLESDRAYL